MVGPDVTPEDGVTRYQHDHTQGPACAIAAGAATIWRNYFAPVAGGIGQTASRQLDGLAAVGQALSAGLGKAVADLWHGYAMCDRAGTMRDLTGNLPMLPGVFPDYSATIVRIAVDGMRELAMARWGMPSPTLAIAGEKTDPGVTNIRNVKSPLAAMARRRKSLHRPLYQLR